MHPQRTIRLFAGARQAVGQDSLSVAVADDASAEQILAAIAAAAPQLSGLLPACRLVADQSYLEPQQTVAPGAELALIPPVSGG
ncbi:MoaD/ThiS family protein [Roseimaritima ulvae]|uniref:Molybdopterin synthase sulfur carrier subunit n=1 Tax=Roseimaritima ulvae TaxID=980254 RepID=A0A5B9QKT8_9BACT|nr:MoaD/ThiS family protein [Roseimaritima ulvae]QEG39688.1 ThiS family protein [Roseimaritima ulvae]